jgi:hypothetical protein
MLRKDREKRRKGEEEKVGSLSSSPFLLFSFSLSDFS